MVDIGRFKIIKHHQSPSANLPLWYPMLSRSHRRHMCPTSCQDTATEGCLVFATWESRSYTWALGISWLCFSLWLGRVPDIVVETGSCTCTFRSISTCVYIYMYIYIYLLILQYICLWSISICRLYRYVGTYLGWIVCWNIHLQLHPNVQLAHPNIHIHHHARVDTCTTKHGYTWEVTHQLGNSMHIQPSKQTSCNWSDSRQGQQWHTPRRSMYKVSPGRL